MLARSYALQRRATRPRYCAPATQPLAWAFVTESRALDGPVGLVGAGYIGHLFAQQFALAGYQVRAWSPGRSVHTLHDRLRQSVSTLAELGAVESSAVDRVLGLVTVHEGLPAALVPCSAVMESIVEDAEIKAACYRDVEAVVRADALLWSSTSNFPMTKLAAGMAHPERAVVLHPVQTALIIFAEVVAGERTSEDSVTTTMRFCEDVSLRAVRVRKEIPGFLWNRVWFALLREMLHLVDIGAADPVELDSMVQTTLRAFIPVFGPLHLCLPVRTSMKPRELRCPVDTSATTSPSSSTETMPRMSPAVSGRLSRAGQSLSASPQSLLLRRRHHGRA